MNNKTRFNIAYFLVALAFLLLLENYFLSPNVLNIGYSDFKVLLNEGSVNELLISADTIEGKLAGNAHDRLAGLWGEKDEKKIMRMKETNVFSTVRLEDPDLVRELGAK